jgi:hypothetical protein
MAKVCNAIGAHHDEIEMKYLCHNYRFVMLFQVQDQVQEDKY